ncbi:hypothetical protein ACFXTO_006605 [Malus domestica]
MVSKPSRTNTTLGLYSSSQNSKVLTVLKPTRTSTSVGLYSSSQNPKVFSTKDAKALVAGVTGALPTHVRRQASEVALAHRSWFEEPPDLIVDLLYEEYNRWSVGAAV